MRPYLRAEMARAWRLRADALDRQAELLRSEGDPREAELVERAATDYREAIEELELGVTA